LSQNPKILFPIFFQCIKYTDNKYFKTIFENIGYGNLPIGIHITNSAIYFENKLICSINNNPKEIYDNMKTIMNTFKKENDKEIIYETWNQIKKKSIKDVYIQNYLIEMQKKYNLTLTQIKKAYNFITIALLLKLLDKEDLDYQNNKINKIRNISFEYKKIYLKNEIFDKIN